MQTYRQIQTRPHPNLFREQVLVIAIGLAVAAMTSSVALAQINAGSDVRVNEVSPPISAASIAASVAEQQAKNPQANHADSDLLSLFRDAANNDPIFLAARYAYDAGREKRWQGLASLFPQIVGSADQNKNDSQGSITTLDGSSRATQGVFASRGWNLRLTQPLFNWERYETARQGDLSADVAAAQYAAAEQDLVLRVSEAYFNVLNAQDTLQLTRSKKALIQEQLAQAKRNFEVGTATITDTHEAQSRFDLVVAQEIAADADLTIKRGALEQLVGKPIGTLKSLMPDAKIGLAVNSSTPSQKKKQPNKKAATANTPDNARLPQVNATLGVTHSQTMGEWVAQAEDVSYSVIASKLAYEIAKRETSKSIGGHLPSVDLVLQRGYRYSESVALPVSKAYSTQGTVQLNVPIFSSGYTQSVVREKAALEKKALSDFQNVRRSIAQATRQAFLGFNQGLAQVKAYEAAEISALSALESNKLGYEVGVRINIDVLNAQDTLITTRRDLAKARYDTILNGLRLKAQAAILSSEDLQAINTLLK